MAGLPDIRPRLIRWAIGLLLLALLLLGLRRLDVPALAAALAHADLRLAALAAVCNVLQIALKSERWRLLLRPFARLPPSRLYYYLAVSGGASMVLPQALSEALRVHVLRRRHGVPVAASVAVVLVEKLFEAVGFAVILLPAPIALPLPRAVAAVLLALCIGGLAFGAAVAAFARTAGRGERALRWGPWARMSPALDALRDPATFAAALAWSVAAHAAECAVIVLMLRAVRVGVPASASVLVLFGHATGVLLPLTPGRVGLSEAGIVAALGLLGVPVATALAFALAYRAVLLGPLLFLAPGHRLVAEGRAEVRAAGAPDAPPAAP